MVKLLKQSSISLHFEKHKGSTDWTTRHNEREPGQRHSNKNIKPDKTKDNIFPKPKMTERMASGWMIWRLDTGKLKAIRKTQIKMVEAVTTWGIIARKAKKWKSRR